MPAGAIAGAEVADRFGAEWDAYCHRVKIPWL